MSTRRSGVPAEKKISSCVRPGVCEVRASALRPVSALIRLDLPTFERPTKAISTPCIGGSRSIVPVAAMNCQSAANSLRPASISFAVKGMVPAGQDEESFYVFVSGAFFFTNSSLTLSHNSILAPCLFMMKACCSTESVLFQAQ